MPIDFTMTDLRIINTIRRMPNAEKGQLSEYTDFSYPTIVTALKKFSDPDHDLILIEDDIVNLKSDSSFYIGISIGQSQIKVVLLDYNFNYYTDKYIEAAYEELMQSHPDLIDDNHKFDYIKEKGICISTPDSRVDLVKIINDVVEKLVYNEKYNVEGIGIAFPGMVDQCNNKIVASSNLSILENLTESSLFNPKLLNYLYEKEIVIVFEHNAKAAVIAEKEKSANCLTGEKNMACLYLGTGIGVGYIFDNKLFRGTQNNSGQIGHSKLSAPLVNPSNSIEKYGKCACEQYGCVEHLIRKEVFGNVDDFKNFDICQATEVQIVNLSKYIAFLISNILNFLALDTIVITGRLSKIYNRLWAYLISEYPNLCFDGLETLCSFRTSSLGLFAPAVGSAICAYFKKYNHLLDWN